MKIATLLFTYHRSYHTGQVISALKRSSIHPQKLFVFQDGLKPGDDGAQWREVNNLINGIDWCDKEVIIAEYNKGLANSIVAGINYAFRGYDAVIVLEDDCVPTVNFIDFMQQCFDKYKDKKDVYSVSGYSWPITLEKTEYDVYGCGRISSWGWGPWKDRWCSYEKDYELASKMKKDKNASENLALWGMDLEDTLVGNVRGICDSWAVFWALNVIAKKGICINPYESFIRNIGMDGTGVHCGVTDQFEVKCIDEKKHDFCLPDNIGFLNETIKAFIPLHGSYTALNRQTADRSRVLVYGLGNFYLKNEKQISHEYYVDKFIDRSKKGYFAGKEIIKLRQLEQCSFDKIIIMLQDEKENNKVAYDISKNYGVPEENIISGISKYDV